MDFHLPISITHQPHTHMHTHHAARGLLLLAVLKIRWINIIKYILIIHILRI